jgi:hypothetical protein
LSDQDGAEALSDSGRLEGGAIMGPFQKHFSVGRFLVVIAAFALALAVVSPREPYVAFLTPAFGLSAMLLRSRGEFLTVTAIGLFLSLLLGPTSWHSHCSR